MRRRFLMGMVLDKGIWENYSYTYLYHSLIPQTIDSYNVLNKARLGTIEGNSEVVNQLVENGNFESASGWTIAQGGTLSYGTNKLIVNTNGSDQVWVYQPNHSVIANHKYLCVVTTKATMNCSFWFTIPYYSYVNHQLVANQKLLVSEIVTPNTSNSGNIAIRFNTGTDVSGGTIEFEDFMVIDLTQMFPFDTPTTLTDVRVQNILAQGYIPHNTGEIKDTLISELEAQPYNLFDEIWEVGSWTNPAQVTNCNSKNYISVVPNQTYTFELQHSSNIYVLEYDKNKNLIKDWGGTYGASSKTFQVGSNCYYVRVMLYEANTNFTDNFPQQSCLHRTGTRTGYAPYQEFAKLTNFKTNEINGIGNAFINGDSQYSFAKRIAVIDLSTISFTYSNNFWRANISGLKLPTVQTDLPNAKCQNYQIKTWFDISSSDTNAIAFLDGGSNNVICRTSDSETQPSGLLYCELATYQNINVPLNHLGMVDLGTLNWQTVDISTNRSYCGLSGAKLFNNDVIANIYCERFISDTYTRVGGNSSALESIALGTLGNSAYLYIKTSLINSSTDTTAKIKQALSGIYLYYETNDYVSETGIITDNGKMLLPAPLQLGGVNTAHNTFEVSNTGYVFTRNVAVVDLGTLNWVYDSSNTRFRADLSSLKHITESTVPNVICSKNYTIIAYQNNTGTDKTLFVYADNNAQRVFIRDSSYTDATTFKTAMSGVSLKYELSTPQVITIPKKHLGVAKISDLSWSYQSGNLRFYTNDLRDLIVIPQTSEVPNVYCNAVLTKAFSSGGDLSLFIYTNGSFFIKDLSISTTTDFLNKYGNYYIFYETEDEVSDFTNSVNIQSGGTLNSDSVVLPNVEIEMKCK